MEIKCMVSFIFLSGIILNLEFDLKYNTVIMEKNMSMVYVTWKQNKDYIISHLNRKVNQLIFKMHLSFILILRMRIPI